MQRRTLQDAHDLVLLLQRCLLGFEDAQLSEHRAGKRI